MKKYSNENLEKVTSYIEEYFIANDSFSKEFLIDEIPFAMLKNNINSTEENDTELYLTYDITIEMANELNKNLTELFILILKSFNIFCNVLELINRVSCQKNTNLMAFFQHPASQNVPLKCSSLSLDIANSIIKNSITLQTP